MALNEEQIRLILDTTESQSAVHKLAEEVTKLNSKLVELKDDFRQGDWTEQQYIETSDKLTASLKVKSRILEEVADEAETGKGFGGLAKNVFKGERAFHMLTSPGSGLARAGPMLESVTTAMGLTSGVGFAVVGLMYAVREILPELEKMFGLFDTDKIKAAADAIEEFHAKAKQREEKQTRDEKTTEQAVDELFAGKHITGMAAGALGTMGIGAHMTQEDKEAIARRQSMIGPGQVNVVEQQVEARLAKENMDTAARLVAQAGQGGPQGIQARAMLRDMATQAPGAFPKGFAGQLAGVEPAARKEWAGLEDEIDEQTDKAVEGSKRKKKREQEWKQGINRQDAVIRQMEAKDEAEKQHEAAQKLAWEQKAEREQRQADREKQLADAKAARENTAEKQKERAIAGEIQAQGGAGADPDFLRQVARQASTNVTMGADIASAVQFAVRQVQIKIQADFLRGMSTMNQQMNGTMGANPTLYGRGGG